MRVGGFDDPLPNLVPNPLPLPRPHFLQAAGVQLGFVNDLDGDLEVEGRCKRSRSQGLKLGKPLSNQITRGCPSSAPSHRKPSIRAIPGGREIWASGPLHKLLPLCPVQISSIPQQGPGEAAPGACVKVCENDTFWGPLCEGTSDHLPSTSPLS